MPRLAPGRRVLGPLDDPEQQTAPLGVGSEGDKAVWDFEAMVGTLFRSGYRPLDSDRILVD